VAISSPPTKIPNILERISSRIQSEASFYFGISVAVRTAVFAEGGTAVRRNPFGTPEHRNPIRNHRRIGLVDSICLRSRRNDPILSGFSSIGLPFHAQSPDDFSAAVTCFSQARKPRALPDP
jgi:hypothetical protein